MDSFQFSFLLVTLFAWPTGKTVCRWNPRWIVERHQPATFLLENVQGLTMRKKGQAKVGQPCLQTWQSCLAGVNAVQVMDLLKCYTVPCFLQHSHLSIYIYSCAVVVVSIPSFASACCMFPRSFSTLSWEQALSEMPGSHHTGAGYSTWFGRLSGAAFSWRNTDGWGRRLMMYDPPTSSGFSAFLKASWITTWAPKVQRLRYQTQNMWFFKGIFDCSFVPNLRYPLMPRLYLSVSRKIHTGIIPAFLGTPCPAMVRGPSSSPAVGWVVTIFRVCWSNKDISCMTRLHSVTYHMCISI